MAIQKQPSEFFRQYDLLAARRCRPAKEPAAHQQKALWRLNRWYESKPSPLAGGILMLPTGGGKTFTAVHFLCRLALSDGYKILWLAHTHHLLEQAYFCFGDLVGLIAEPKAELRVRVVSGTEGHFKVKDIEPTDDVVVGTLQTIWNAVKNDHPQLESFLKAANGKLFVVLDEAHHAPAPTYRELVHNLNGRFRQLWLLGLTATPTYTDERKRGWLAKLFPQGILHQVSPKELMGAGILAKPILEEARTDIEAEFDEREYEKWIGTYKDLPDSVVSHLAENQKRNDFIVGFYLHKRKTYGKTIIFADRWFQCEYLREAFRKQGVKADAVYSHVDADPGSAEARNRRTAGENARVLQEFKEGRLEVLINVRMLTEGTDVPDVQTVFLTRQTTSQILLTQMVGRALRGPKFGGTPEAYIVSFIDNWKQRINWAEYAQLAEGLADERVPEYGKHPPLALISIDLVRRLSRQMDRGINMTPGPFLSLLPKGWYHVEYHAQVQGSDETESISRLVMVFEHEEQAFQRYLKALKGAQLDRFQGEGAQLGGDVLDQLNAWREQFFSQADEHVGGDELRQDLFDLARHMAQNDKQVPKFFSFDKRDQHDLDAVARKFVDDGLNYLQADQALKREYARKDRYWRVIYYTYHLFKSQYDACVNRILDALDHGKDPKEHQPVFKTPQAIPDREPSDELKEQIKSRDRYRCLCCEYDKKRSFLEVDHIAPSYFGGTHLPSNLQTLCKTCNQNKGINEFNYRNMETMLNMPPSQFPKFDLPRGDRVGQAEWWEMFLRRSINVFYQCAAVGSVQIGKRGESARHWRVWLNPGNNSQWVQPYMQRLVGRIRQAQEKAGFASTLERISISQMLSQGQPGVKDILAKNTAGDRTDEGIGNGFMKPLQPDEALAKVVGTKPLPPTEVLKRLWAYIEKNGLQNSKKKTQINADSRLLPVFNGKKQVSMVEMAVLISKHLK